MSEMLSNMMNGKSSNTSVKENGQLFFKHDFMRIRIAHGLKLVKKCIKYMVVHSKLTTNSFGMSTQQFKHPGLSSECRSMIFHLVEESSIVVFNCSIESIDNICKLRSATRLFYVGIF